MRPGAGLGGGATGFCKTGPAMDNATLYLVLAAVLAVVGVTAGLVVALAMVGGLTWSDSSLRRMREVHAELGLRPIGSVPLLVQKGRV